MQYYLFFRNRSGGPLLDDLERTEDVCAAHLQLVGISHKPATAAAYLGEFQAILPCFAIIVNKQQTTQHNRDVEAAYLQFASTVISLNSP